MTIKSYATCVRVAACLVMVPLLLMGENALPVPSNLKVESIPPIPVSLMETLSRYAETRAATLQDWHPIKRELLISTRFGDVPQIHRVTMPGGARTQLTFYPERVSNARYQPKNGESFLFSKDVGGSEFFQIFLYDTKTGDSRLLTDGKSRNTSAEWSDDGRFLAYASTRRNGKDTDIYVADPSDPKTARRLLEVEGGGWEPLDWSPDGKTLLVAEYRSIAESSFYLVNASTGAKETLTPTDRKAAYDNAVFSPDGKGVYLTTDRDSEFHRLA